MDKKVLLAENKAIDAAYMRLMLEREGFRTEVVKDGNEVLQNLKKDHYLLVVLNEHLSQMGGIETVTKIREQEKENGGHIPVLGLTPYSLSAARKKFNEAGSDFCLSKPVYKQRLLNILAKIEVASRKLATN